MKSIDEVAVIVQARLGSQRTPRKMIRPFAGSTLVDIALEKLEASKVIPKQQLILAVHEPDLIQIGEAHGVNVFRRSKRSAKSEGVPLTDLYEWWDRLAFRYAVLVNACAPLLRTETVDAFVTRYLESEGDGLFGVIEKRNYFWDHKGALLSTDPGRGAVMDTKIVGTTYEAAHCLYAGRLSEIGAGRWMGDLGIPGDFGFFPMEELEAFDIDDPWEFEVGELLYRHRDRVGP
jgi:CMP-N-acetylneuraminic acid synthetase